MTQLQVGKTYKNLNPHAGKTFNNLAGRSVYIPKQFTVLKDDGPLLGLEIHSYQAIDDTGEKITIDDDDAKSLELME